MQTRSFIQSFINMRHDFTLEKIHSGLDKGYYGFSCVCNICSKYQYIDSISVEGYLPHTPPIGDQAIAIYCKQLINDNLHCKTSDLFRSLLK